MPSYIPPLNPVNPDDVRRALNFGTATLLDVGTGADNVAPGNVVSGISAAYSLAATAVSGVALVSGSVNVAQTTANNAVSGVSTAYNLANTAIVAADSAQSAANTAQGTANSAVSGVSTAYNLANTAISEITVVSNNLVIVSGNVNTISGSVNVAQTTANNAVSGVSTAYNLANNAATNTALSAETSARFSGDAANAAATAIITNKIIARPSPNLRGPNQIYDYSFGYTPINLSSSPQVFADRWIFQGDAWVCEQNLPGFGAWSRNYGAMGYPGSSVTTVASLLFSGGTLRMVSGYAGPALNVINPVSGANKDIGLLLDDTLDEKSLWSFMGAAGYLYVAKVYDQTGNGNHITQAATANQYVIVPNMRVGRAVALINDSDIFSTPVVTKFMTIPSTLSVATGGSLTGVSIGNVKSFNAGVTAFAMTGTDGKTYGTAIASDFLTGNGGNNVPPSIGSAGLFPINIFVTGFGCADPISGASSNIYANGKMAYEGTAGGAGFTGGFLGIQATGDQAGAHEIAGIMIYNAILQLTADPQALISNLEYHFGVVPQIKDTLICDGDSITYGYLAAYNQDYPHQIGKMLSHYFQIVNTGYPGNTTTQRLAALPGILKYVYSSSAEFNATEAQNVLVEWSGTNDIGLGGTTLATMQSNMQQIVALGKAAFCKVVVCTTLPQNSFTPGSAQETMRESWNTWLRSGASGADALADVAADPTMGNYANTTPGQYYVDGTHPTALGHSFTAPIIARAVNSLVP